jgi:hypothetical protein
MIAFAIYLLKVIICSGILFLYYHLALRNKLFHQWNRFYLLAAIVISLVAPIVQVTIMHSADQPAKAIEVLQVFQSADGYLEEITIGGSPFISPDQWLMMGYGIVSALFSLSVLLSFQKIIFLLRSHTIQWIEKIKFINTKAQGTPFSFFNFIFWNEEIDLQTETGQQIFQHELVHVKEKHSFDKLFIQIVLIVFWCNPFFWLIRRELKLIHEFIADKKAVGEHGTAALAAMILNSSYPAHFNSLTNHFFQTSIKRRIAMLAKIKNPRVNYLSRILALPIIAITVVAFTVRAENENSKEIKSEKTLLQKQADSFLSDTVPQKKSETVENNKSLVIRSGSQAEPLYILDGKEVTGSEAKKLAASSISSINVFKDSLGKTKYGEKGKNGVIEITTKSFISDNSTTQPGGNLTLKPFQSTPLIIIDGEETTKDEMQKLDPSSIETINVLKDKSAEDKYGTKGKNGVIEIITKKTNRVSDEITFHLENENYYDTVPKNQIFTKVEIEASVDKEQWRQFLQKNLQPFIEDAAAKGIKPGTYTIKLKFIVASNGSLYNFQTLNDPGYDLAKNVIEMMKDSPTWNPAMQNGKPVTSYHTQPVTFVIQEQ